MRIALIGFGEVGQTLARDLGGHELAAFDLLFADSGSGPSRAIAAADVAAASDAAGAVRGAAVIVSAVTAAQDLAAARSVGRLDGALFVDLNSCSPGQKIASAEAIAAQGGRYVEAAVMAPIGPRRIASPILLGGPHAADAAPVLEGLGFSGARFYSDVLGKAAATKLCRSVMIKGVEALLAESLLSARYYGVEQEVLASLSDLLPVGDWDKLARYMIERSLEHGARRAEEMEEAARTVEEAGVEPAMALATVRRQAYAGARREALRGESLTAMLDAIREQSR
jgi:3-hydroxyisobutyrate dehydrogenase-like beta-hydroxyacid dehydrogenase